MTKIKNIAAALLVMVLFAGTSFAGTKVTGPMPVMKDDPTGASLTVNFLGEDADYLYFQMSVKAGSSKFVTFAISDKTEGELYSATFRADKEQTLKIEKRHNQELVFDFGAGKKSYSESFIIMPAVTLARL